MKDVYYNLLIGYEDQWGTRYESYDKAKEDYKRCLEEGLNPRLFIYINDGCKRECEYHQVKVEGSMSDTYYSVVIGNPETVGRVYHSFESAKKEYNMLIEEGYEPMVFIYLQFQGEWKRYRLDMETYDED